MDAVDIQRKYLQRERTRCEVYQKILEKCFRRIEIAVEQGVTNFVFDIPPWSWGLPRYSMPDAAAYIQESLQKKGYRVTSAGKFSLLVDWSEYLPERSQIRDMVRWEGNTKWKQPRNRVQMPSVSSWILDQPLRPANWNSYNSRKISDNLNRNFIPLPPKSVKTEYKKPEKPEKPEKKSIINTTFDIPKFEEKEEENRKIVPLLQPPVYPTIRENVAPQRSHLFIPPPQLTRDQFVQQPNTFIAPPQQTQPFLDRPRPASASNQVNIQSRRVPESNTVRSTVKEMLEKPAAGGGRKIKIEW